MPIVGAPKGPDEMVGKAFMDLQAQRTSQAEFNDTVERAGKMRAAPTRQRAPENTGYC